MLIKTFSCMLRSTGTVLKADCKKKINMYFFSGKFEKFSICEWSPWSIRYSGAQKHPEHQSVNLYILPFYSVLRAEHIFIRLDKPSRKYYFISLVATLHKVTISDRKSAKNVKLLPKYHKILLARRAVYRFNLIND